MRSRSASAWMLRLLLFALGAKLRRLGDAGRAHPVVHRLAGGFRQIGAADAQIDHLDAELRRLRLQLVGDASHQLGTLVRQHLGEADARDLGAQRSS